MAVLQTFALTDLASVKESLGIDSGDTSRDNFIIRKINQATAMIEGYCGLDSDHHFKETTYTDEEYTATGTNELYLRARPISSVAGFSIRNSYENTNNWDSYDTEDFYIGGKSGLIRTNFGISGGWNSYRVTYTAGYATIPDDLAEACVTLACFLAENVSTGTNVKKKQEGRRSIEYHQSTQGASIIDELGIDDILDRYSLPSLAGF